MSTLSPALTDLHSGPAAWILPVTRIPAGRLGGGGEEMPPADLISALSAE